jgi:hypothetical protein
MTKKIIHRLFFLLPLLVFFYWLIFGLTFGFLKLGDRSGTAFALSKEFFGILFGTHLIVWLFCAFSLFCSYGTKLFLQGMGKEEFLRVTGNPLKWFLWSELQNELKANKNLEEKKDE